MSYYEHVDRYLSTCIGVRSVITKNKPIEAKTAEVGVMFRAPQELRGAVRKISAWAEMADFRINGKVPLEKDIWAWMAASLYASGESNWPEMLKNASDSFKSISRKTSSSN